MHTFARYIHAKMLRNDHDTYLLLFLSHLYVYVYEFYLRFMTYILIGNTRHSLGSLHVFIWGFNAIYLYSTIRYIIIFFVARLSSPHMTSCIRIVYTIKDLPDLMPCAIPSFHLNHHHHHYNHDTPNSVRDFANLVRYMALVQININFRCMWVLLFLGFFFLFLNILFASI